MALTILIYFFFIAISSADLLTNPYFESPPTNMTSNSTSPFLLQANVNTIPGWSFDGTVHYITSGPNISLPGNGHGIQLGRGGKINQTFILQNYYDTRYILTFSLAPGNKNCSNKNLAVNISVGTSSKVFSLQRGYGKEMWESHAYYLDVYSLNGHVNLKIQSAAIDMDANDTCYPIVGTFMIGNYGYPRGYEDNLLYNGGFEMGPAFVKNSTEGIILDDEPDSYKYTIDQWLVTGTVKYINSEYYSVPEGKAAVELVSHFDSGIQRKLYLKVGYNYTLNFTIGDANNSCLGSLTVHTLINFDYNNFTIISNGKGLAKNVSMTFVAKDAESFLVLYNLNQSKSSDNLPCGPVIDNVILRYTNELERNSSGLERNSSGLGENTKNAFIFPYVIFIITLHLCSYVY